jgi:hypothetical protein
MNGIIFIRQGCATSWPKCPHGDDAITVLDYTKRDKASTWTHCISWRQLMSTTSAMIAAAQAQVSITPPIDPQ